MINQYPGAPPPIVNIDAYPRTLGVLFLLIGLVCGAVAFYFPIRDIIDGATKITLFSKAVWAFITCTGIGLIFIILGPIPARLALKYAALRGWKKWLVIALVVVFFAYAGIALQESIQEYLGQLGYEVKFE
jgi:hypothetical protein